MKIDSFNLQKQLRFSPEAGTITLGHRRMLLFSQDAFRLLRQLMFDQLGDHLGRSLLMKFGYQHGYGDFQNLQGMFDLTNEEDRLGLGPLMHSWSGIVNVEPVLMEMDRDKGHFHFKGLWHNSYEAQIHLQQFGRSKTPVCHTLSGYGSGWCSSFFGHELLEIETKCVACGDEHCEWEIRPIDQWGPEADPWRHALRDSSSSIHKQLESSRAKIAALNTGLEEEVRRRTEENKHLLRVVCHDLTNPLEIVRASVQTLRHQALVDQGKSSSVMKPLEGAVESLCDIIRHVHEMQKVQSGKAELELKPVPLAAILKPLSIVWRHKLRAKDLTLKVDQDSPQIKVLADPKVLGRHVIGNLLSNAIKFSPRGGTIQIKVSATDQDVSLTISDQGVGIAPDKVSRLFAASLPTTTLGTEGEKGSGFGLPIVKQYVDLHRGKIEVISNPEKEAGSHFRISLPVVNAIPPATYNV